MKAILRAGQFLQRRRSKDALDLEITSTHGDDSLGIERGLSIKANGQEIVGMRVGTHGHVHLAVKMLTAKMARSSKTDADLKAKFGFASTEAVTTDKINEVLQWATPA